MSNLYPPGVSRVRVRPPTAGSRSKTVTGSPSLASRRADARPPGPAPMTATREDTEEVAMTARTFILGKHPAPDETPKAFRPSVHGRAASPALSVTITVQIDRT